ncbi:hypothetical protein [Halomonas sp. KO116]|uniref:hypothetical protein n=1 Tax=Halomonas sp. KO116 TaxID=1504981 RepID=UPI0004E368D4|nr:hypothetical protein [Halomonas sp. KO116]AJY53207.1 hypothetical protein KO116_P200100 [Halomonas sp. KO116]
MAKTKSPRKRTAAHSNKPISVRERSKIEQMARLAYSWRYVLHSRAEAGEPIPAHHHGKNLLCIATPEKIEATYTVASGTFRHWQAIVIAYVRDGESEYRSWAWVQTQTPIIASKDGISPLLAHANSIALEGMEQTDDCYARATILAPWDAKHPILPDRYAARLQSRLGLTKEDIVAVSEWDKPEIMTVSASEIELDIALAKALRESDALTD